jgi:hypothetical protein
VTCRIYFSAKINRLVNFAVGVSKNYQEVFAQFDEEGIKEVKKRRV